MSKTNGKGKPVDLTPLQGDDLTPAAAYLRMSDDDQEGSIEQQRREILAFAAGKYRIVGWYIDAGKSGSKDQHKRVEFRRLVLDSGKGEWQAVLVWKTSRFGRLDSLEGADAKNTLRKAGVYLVSVKEGVIDWNTMAGRIMDALHSEMDHAYSASLASDSLRGRLAELEKGHWPNGAIPYGYHRLYVAPDRREVLVKRTEPFRKPEGWLLRLVVCEDEAAVVRWVFDQVLTLDRSRGAIARDLNRRGVPPPAVLGKTNRGGGWSPERVLAILTNPAYVGTGYLGSGRGYRRKGQFASADDVRKAGCCPPLVDPDVFEQVQAVLAARKGTRRKPRVGSGALSGVLYCSRCGYRLATNCEGGRVSYVCRSPSTRPGATACRKWRVYEDEILPRVCRKLVETVDGELLKALEAGPPASDRLSDLDMVREQVAALEKAIDEAAGRYLRAPVELMPALEKQLQQMRKDLAELAEKYQRLASRANEGAVSNFARWWQTVRGSLLLVRVKPEGAGEEGSAEAAAVWWNATRAAADPAEQQPEGGNFALVEPAALRSLLHRLGVKVKCSWRQSGSLKKKTRGQGRGPSYVLSRAVLTAGGESTTLTSVPSPAAASPAGQSSPGQPVPPGRRPSSPGRRLAQSSENPGPTNRRTGTTGVRGNRTRPGCRWPTPRPAGSPSGTSRVSSGRCGRRRCR
jgi:DNA invertase Pin-like site-specific DNA recombinase